MNLSIFVIDAQIKILGKTVQKKAVIFLLGLLLIYSLPLPVTWAKSDQSDQPAKTGLFSGPDGATADGLIQEKLTEKPSSPPTSSSFTSSMLKTSLSLSLVLALIWAIAYLIKKYYLKGNLLGGKFIRLLDTCPLGQKKSLALIRVENQTLLLAITNQRITLLSQIEQKPAETKGQAKKAPENFAEQLSLNSLKLQPPSESTSIAGILESRFKGLKKV